jgi:hypothetical protein
VQQLQLTGTNQQLMELKVKKKRVMIRSLLKKNRLKKKNNQSNLKI